MSKGARCLLIPVLHTFVFLCHDYIKFEMLIGEVTLRRLLKMILKLALMSAYFQMYRQSDDVYKSSAISTGNFTVKHLIKNISTWIIMQSEDITYVKRAVSSTP